MAKTGSVKYSILDRNFTKCWKSLVVFLVATFDLDQSKLQEFQGFISILNRNHGLRQTIKVCKDLNSVVRRFCLRQPLYSSTFGGMWMDTFKETGIPKSLPYLNDLSKTHPLAAIMITNMYQCFRIEPEIDLTTVEKPSTVGEPSLDSITNFKEFVSNELSSAFVPIDFEKHKFHFSLKAGPLVNIALLGAMFDLVAILSDEKWKNDFPELCNAVGHTKLLQCYETFKATIENDQLEASDKKSLKGVNKWLAKLSFLANPGGKTRIVFILNWWLQELVYPLHNSMMDWLRQQSQDATFFQRDKAMLVKEWTGKKLPIYSYDLSAATDRWPIWHQEIVIRAYAGDKWADTWKKVLKVKPYVKPINRYTDYAVGQPMGAYASWAALAMSHHMVIRFLAKNLGVPAIYTVLGDDVTIVGKDLAYAYREYMENVLGVNISELKSFSHDNVLEGHSSAEFGKAIFVDGQELTPVSPVLLKEIYVDHKWWKIIDVLKWYRDTCRQSPYRDEFGKLFVPKPIIKFIETLDKVTQDKMTILISSGEFDRSLNKFPIERDKEVEYVEVLDPWLRGIDNSNLPLLYAKGTIVNEKMSQLFSSLSELKRAFEGEERKVLAGYGLSVEGHPVHEALKDLSDSVTTVARCIADGDHPANAVNLLLDMKLIKLLLIEGKGIESWMRSNRDSFLKEKDHYILRVHELTVQYTSDPTSIELSSGYYNEDYN